MPKTARSVAVECLVRCEQGGYSNLVLRNALSQSELSRRDRAFCTALVCGTLSRIKTLDYLLSGLVKGGLSKLDAEVRAILRMGVFQLFWMESVPQRAAVYESVSLCKQFKKSSASGLVNAVLRRCGDLDVEKELSNIKDSFLRMATKGSVCESLLKELADIYGDDTEKVLQRLFEPAEIYVRVNTLKCTKQQLMDELAAEGMTVEETTLPSALLIKDGFFGECAALKEGRMRVQSLPAQMAAAAVGAKSGERVLDLCSAPGGKTLCMAQDMQNEGRITACDVNEKRLSLVAKQSVVEGVSIVETCRRSADEFKSDELFDRILCDVPCSGYGEIASKPELRYKETSVSQDLPALQMRILENAARLLKVGGVLVYSTCTLLKRENEDIVNAFLSSHREFEPRDVSHLSPESAIAAGQLRFNPALRFGEGFYIASFTKVC